MRGERLVFFITAAAWLVLDLGTKQFMQDLLGRVGSVLWFDGFRFVLVYNHGAAFGFLSSAGGWQRGFFIVLAALVALYLVWRLWLARPREKQFNLGLSFILGGAVGNMVERINHGYVIDFIDIYVGAWHWPAFNIADIAISIGAVIVIADSLGLNLLGRGRQEAPKKDSGV